VRTLNQRISLESCEDDGQDSRRVLEEGGASIDASLLVSRHGACSRLGVVNTVVPLLREMVEEVVFVLIDCDLLRQSTCVNSCPG
jgi:hypothetical protein